MSQASNKALIQSKEKRQSIKSIILEFGKSKEYIDEHQALTHVNSIYKYKDATKLVQPRTITARISDLMDEGKFYIHHMFNDGNNSAYAFEPNINITQVNSAKRWQDGYIRWLNKGINKNYIEKYQKENKTS